MESQRRQLGRLEIKGMSFVFRGSWGKSRSLKGGFWLLGLAMTGGRKNILAGWKNCNVEDGMMSDCNNYKNRRVEYSAIFCFNSIIIITT